ncbi:MAG TPA: cache domain-containing protein [Thermoanaerobaculia bacterium]
MSKSNAAPDAPVRVDPAARRRRRVLVTPTLLRVLALLSLAALIFGAYAVTWVSSRDAYFTTRNFRILAGLGKQIESIVAVQSDGLRYGALGEEVEEPARQETELSISYPGAAAQTQETRRIRLASGFSPPAREARPDRRRGRPLLGFEAYPEGAYLETAGVKNPRKLSLDPLIEPVLTRDVFDHVLVADSRGNVLFEQENREIRLASLGGLVEGKAGAAGLLQGLQSTARIRDVDLSGGRYDIFVSPLRVPVAREKEDEGAGPWLVCGLVRSEAFRSDSRALPKLPLIGFVVLLILIFLIWPLIKLRSIEGWEHLSRLDLAWLTASMFLIPALLALTIWGGWRFQGLRGLWHQTLRQVADRIAGNLEQDVRAYAAMLEETDRAFLPRAAGGAPVLTAREALARLPFNDVHWVGRDGCQVYKVSFGLARPVIDVSDREYFRSLARDVHPGDGARRRAFVQSINSWTTGEPEMVIALRRPRDPEIPVVAVATPMPSLIDAILPPGFEYAVVQNRREVQRRRASPQTSEPGEVLLHSDKRRNLRENLLQEVTEPSWLGDAVRGRETRWGTVVYQGKERLAYTRPLAVEDRPWSLVVLADSDVLTGLCRQVAITALASTALYGLAVVLLFFLYSRLRGAGGARWLWPQRHRLPGYTALAALLLALVLVYVFALLALGSEQSLIFAALFPLAVLGGLHEALGRPVEAPRQSLRIVLALEVLFLAGLAVLRSGMPTAAMVLWLLAAAVLAALAAAGPEISHGFDRLLAGSRRAPGTYGRWEVERPWHRYLVCLLLAAALLAVLPTVSFVNLAFDSQMEGLVQRTQIALAGELEERETRLAEELGERFPVAPAAAAEAGEAAEPWPPAHGELTADGERCAGLSEAYPAALFGLAAAHREEALAGWLARRLELDRGHDYAALLFDTCVCFDGRTARGEPSRTCSCRERSRVRAAVRAGGCAGRWSAPWLPTSATSPAALRSGAPPQPEVSRPRQVAEEHGACYELPVSDGATGERAMTIITRPPTGADKPGSLLQAAVLAAAAGLAAGLLFLLIRFVTSLVFFQGAAGAGPAGAGRPLLHLALDRSGLPPLSPPPPPGWRLLDLRAAAAGGAPAAIFAVEDEARVIAVDHFDLPGEAAAAARESLLRHTRGRRLVLLCDRLAQGPPEPGAPAAPLLLREGDALRPARDAAELARAVREDAFLTAEVEELEGWLLDNCGDLRQVIDLLADALRPVHEVRWSALEPAGEAGRERSQEEKLILHALVRGRLVTAKAGRRLRHLAAEGFITQDPKVRIVGASQRVFIRNQAAREVQAAREALDANSLWSQVRTPMAIGVVLLLAFLFLTQRDLFTNIIVQVGTIGGGIAALLQFLTDRRHAGTKPDGV